MHVCLAKAKPTRKNGAEGANSNHIERELSRREALEPKSQYGCKSNFTNS